MVNEPRLWWPVGMGEQPLYDLTLEFVVGGATSAVATSTFGIRKVTKELYIHEKWPGLRIYINGQKCFSRWRLDSGGSFARLGRRARIDAEVRYFAQANLNTVCFEDIPMPADEFLDACDRHGVLFWNAFYGSHWVTAECDWNDSLLNPFTMPYAKPVAPGRERNYPLDHDLFERCTVDILKRYRNHPSLIVYSCMGEGMAGRMFTNVGASRSSHSTARAYSLASPDQKCHFPWLDQDWPSGLDDAGSSIPDSPTQRLL